MESGKEMPKIVWWILTKSTETRLKQYCLMSTTLFRTLILRTVRVKIMPCDTVDLIKVAEICVW